MYASIAKKRQAARYARWDAGGEGTRGGKVIGHTTSGKPIYENAGHPRHRDFTAVDHQNAANTHAQMAQRVEKHNPALRKSEGDKARLAHHEKQIEGHMRARKAISKQGPSEIMQKKAEKNLAAHNKAVEQNKAAIIERQKQSGAMHTTR